MEITKELEAEPEDLTESLQSHDKTWMGEDLLLTDEQIKWFLEIGIYSWWRCCEDCWNDNKEFEILHIAAAGLERTDYNFKRSSIMGKMLSSSIAWYKEITKERKSQSLWLTLLLSYFKKLSQPPQSSDSTNMIGWGKTLHQQKDYNSLKVPMMISIF